MRKSFLAPTALAWALAAVLAVALPCAPSAWAATAAEQIAVQLPGGVSLSRATVPQTAVALHDAVATNPPMAEALLESALMAKAKSKGRKLTSKEVKLLVSAAMSAAPDKSSELLQIALSMYPGYADQLGEVAPTGTSSAGNAPSGFNTPQDLYGGFGVGFGPGFPGSPGFSGSSPSGAFALPNGSLTNVVNG